MNKSETGQLMSILEVAYPRFYINKTDEERKQALNLWFDCFKDYDSKIVAAALKALIVSDVQGYPPGIGAVMDRVRLITEPPQLTEFEIWALVARAASRGMYHSKEEFAKLPPLAQRIVGSPNTLVEWGQLDADQFHTVIQSNFMRSYRVLALREQSMNALPADVKKLIDGINRKMLGQSVDDDEY